MSSESGEIADKDHYWELKPRQKAIVDAFVEDDDRIQQEIADRAEELLEERDVDDDSVSRSYVSEVLNTYANIIDKQLGGDGGESDADDAGETGDPYGGALDADDAAYQSIGDRPYEGDADAEAEAEAGEGDAVGDADGEHPTPTFQHDDGEESGITVTLDRVTCRMGGGVGDDTKHRVIDQILDRAYSN